MKRREKGYTKFKEVVGSFDIKKRLMWIGILVENSSRGSLAGF